MKKSKQKPMPVFYLGADIRRSTKGPDYAKLHSCVEAWMKAPSEDEALESVTHQLLTEGWRITKVHCLVSVSPGFARIGAMVDPPVFSEEEADEWTEQYEIADAEGCAFIFKHYPKKPRKPMVCVGEDI